MAGYYVMSSPSQRIIEHETEYSIKKADLRSIAECVVSSQNAAMYAEDFVDDCVERFEVISQYVCMNKSYNVISCDSEAGKTPTYNFIITTSAPLPQEKYNNMLEILEQYYPDAGTFGIFLNSELMSAGAIARRSIPQKIINAAQLTNGQLIYIMQYKIPEDTIDYPVADGSTIDCPSGTMKTYRFGRWQCIEYNYKISCTGDTIWDESVMDCVEDETRKPLCSNNQTAVMVDNIWECVDPFADKDCPDGMIARLNYNELAWECVEDPNSTKKVKKCDNLAKTPNIKGGIGATLRVRSISCTDCETPVVDEDTCETYCVADATKLNDPKCYTYPIEECSGSTRGIYFGFNPRSRIDSIPELKDVSITLDTEHSQNRKFNCLDCGMGEIDTEKSIYPYTAVCK
ncbi:MAG: hypothetical protein IKP35_01685 [Alphaproteobacteria bacterium]|nr:hypothetical protein [Alphaproteobacteria bacterium]